MPHRCPICRQVVEADPRNETYPFCGSRCRQVDLGNWLTERYRISEDVAESDGIDAETPVEGAEGTEKKADA